MVEDGRKIWYQHSLYLPNRHPWIDALWRFVAKPQRHQLVKIAWVGRRAHQCRSMELVLQSGRTWKMPHHGYLVANRNRRICHCSAAHYPIETGFCNKTFLWE